MEYRQDERPHSTVGAEAQDLEPAPTVSLEHEGSREPRYQEIEVSVSIEIERLYVDA